MSLSTKQAGTFSVQDRISQWQMYEYNTNLLILHIFFLFIVCTYRPRLCRVLQCFHMTNVRSLAALFPLGIPQFLPKV